MDGAFFEGRRFSFVEALRELVFPRHSMGFSTELWILFDPDRAGKPRVFGCFGQCVPRLRMNRLRGN